MRSIKLASQGEYILEALKNSDNNNSSIQMTELPTIDNYKKIDKIALKEEHANKIKGQL